MMLNIESFMPFHNAALPLLWTISQLIRSVQLFKTAEFKNRSLGNLSLTTSQKQEAVNIFYWLLDKKILNTIPCRS